jgi:hypothetical protein
MQGHRTRACLNACASRRFGGAVLAGLVSVAAAPLLSGAALARGQAESAYPARAVLDAFRIACADLGTLDATRDAAVAAGWQRVADPATTPLGGLVAMSEKLGGSYAAKTGGSLDPMTVYVRELAGERLYVVLSGVTSEGRTVNACRLYDVDEKRSIAPATVSAWLGAQPVQSVDRKEIARATWQPGLSPAQDSFELYHVPADSPIVQMTQVAGLAMKADQVEKAK